MDVEPPREPDFEPSGHAKRAFADIGDAGIERHEPDSIHGNGGLQRVPAGPGASLVDTR